MQLELAHARNRSCPYIEFIDDDDNHCNNHGMAPRGYVPLGEDSDDHEFQLATVDGPYLEHVTALPQVLPDLPPYIPVITHGSKKLFQTYTPEWVGVQLGEVLSGTKLRTASDVRTRLGVPASTKVVLLAYGLDFLIENLWQQRRRILKELGESGFDLVTAVNYSIWDMHPHPEKIFNVKRSLITYQEFQEFGVPAIPHVYWYGQKSMKLWAAWLRQNPCVNTIAIDMQTLTAVDWQKFIVELAQFVGLIGRKLRFLVTGPQAAGRIEQIRQILGSVTLTNSYAAVMAWSRKSLQVTDDAVTHEHSDEHKSILLQRNVKVFEDLMSV